MFFEPNPLAGREAAFEPNVVAHLRVVAERIIEAAKADPLPRGGSTYRNSFEIDEGVYNGEPVVSVVNTDPDAVWVEYGAHAGGITPVLGYHVLGRAMDRVTIGNAVDATGDAGTDDG
jgi:hypothetical protein